jgi:lipoprotein-anchoring transpeptidase ErfK/SrfK
MVGNDFSFTPKVRPAAASMAAMAASPAPAAISDSNDYEPTEPNKTPNPGRFDWVHEYSFIIFILVSLLIAAAGIELASRYLNSRTNQTINHTMRHASIVRTSGGLNLTVADDELADRLQMITKQSATLTVGSQSKQLSPETIRSWLQITHDKAKGLDYIHVSQATIAGSLKKLASQYVKAPVNQVVTTHGGVSTVIVNGKSGTKLTDQATLDAQAQQLAKTVLSSSGNLQFSTPLETLAYSTVTPAAFHKLIEVNVVTKQMWLYDDGTLTKSYPISAGAPATPTPIGQFNIYAKFATQDMRGYNADGTKYFQPHVHWINYFLPGGYAVHGNYWRPTSWFGARNSSHGCVSLPDYQAKDVYDWAPIGTTVITHY